eukprot:gene8969-6442_t
MSEGSEGNPPIPRSLTKLSFWQQQQPNAIQSVEEDLHEEAVFSSWTTLKCLSILQSLGFLVQGDRYLIDASKLFRVLSHSAQYDSRCVFYAFQLFSNCSNLSDTAISQSALTSYLSEEMIRQLQIDDTLCDIWLTGDYANPKVNESTSVGDLRRAWESFFPAFSAQSAQRLAASKFVTRIGNCLVPTAPSTDLHPPLVAYTETTVQNLEHVAEAVMMGKPTIFQGEHGSGKISLIKEVARVMGYHDKIVVLQLNDQSDGRSLLGAYVCTDVPGEFKWQAGILTQAALQGYWLVIQDIDKIPLDIIAMMSSLLEFRSLYLPQRKYPIQAHPHFRIFATRSLPISRSLLASPSASANAATSDVDVLQLYNVPHLRHFAYLWFYVDIFTLSGEEIEGILLARFPTIPRFYLQKILQLVTGNERSSSTLAMGTGAIGKSAIGRGSVSLTKALKIAQRLHRYSALHGVSESKTGTELYVTDRLKYFFFQDFVDIFCADARHLDQFYQSVQTLGQFLGMPLSEVEHVLHHHTIDILKTENTIQMGRCLIRDLSSQQHQIHGNNLSFAETKYAKRMLEKILVCVEMKESVLLVGETGTGKTTVVQQLATLFHQELIVQNLSLSTDAGDLLGGFRPATIRDTLLPLYEDFARLFQETMSSAKNAEFLTIIANFFQQKKWTKLLQSFVKGCKSAITKIESAISKDTHAAESLHTKLQEWRVMEDNVTKFQYNLPKLENGFAFRVVKGLLVQAFEKGQWILLDEINLAPPETIQLLSRFLSAQEETITVEMNGGDLTTIKRHPNFRVFAAMNPPTDVCKRELAAATRNKFTELYVDEMTDREDLITMVQSYLGHDHSSYAAEVVDVYLGCRTAAEIHLTDGSGQKPKFSLRSLTRALKAALRFYQMGMKPMGRCLFEGFLLSFQTCLSSKSKKSMYATLLESFYPEGKGRDEDDETRKLDFPCSKPKAVSKEQQWIQAKPFWIEQGHHEEPIDWASPNAAGVANFVSTKTVLKFIRVLSSAVAASVAPILLQGPTSIGKTTVIQYLAAKLGYHCVRINNHEHTDVQEYVGGYVTGVDGKMVFQDGLLVQALRHGYWIILDELNLAPSEVLEALNRLLDDNRELLIPETGEIIKPAKGFQLFATQNPPGIYGGRKPLSLAFRNRFIEIDLDDIPPKEMEQIITTRCGIAPKFATMMVKVCEELQIQRQQSNFLLGKEGSITMRDLLKWGNRSPQNPQDVAQFGYMLLCEKLRSSDEKDLVRKLLAKVCKLTAANTTGAKDKDKPESVMTNEVLYGSVEALLKVKSIIRESKENHETGVAEGIEDVAITQSFNRMWHLLSGALDHSEPVLLVGDTGAGKTMAGQLYAAMHHRPIRILNCHQTTETADIIGSLRPVRGRQQLLADASAQLSALVHECLTASLLEPTALLTALDAEQADRRRKQRDGESDNDNDIVEEISLLDKRRLDLLQSWASQAANDQTVDHQQWLDQLNSLLQGYHAQVTAAVAVSATEIERNSVKGTDATEAAQESHKKKKRKTSASATPAQTSTVNPVAIAASPVLEAIDVWQSTTKSVQRIVKKAEALFEWVDGPLVESMREGAIFVLDEINLAEDAVIERLNSVLEYKGELTLAEKGGAGDGEDGSASLTIKPHPSFRIIATMNPSGDFGKRELSPALRSRLTEVWIPNSLSFDERALLVSTYLHLPTAVVSSQSHLTLSIAQLIVRFTGWIQEKLHREHNLTLLISNREIISWTKFVNAMIEKMADTSGSQLLGAIFANVIHGAYLTMLDGLSMLQGMTTDIVNAIRLEALDLLLNECTKLEIGPNAAFVEAIKPTIESLITVRSHFNLQVHRDAASFKVGYFSTPLGPQLLSESSSKKSGYVFETPKVTLNVGRILRAMQIGRPILLEGPPGVGKTSLITNLAKQTGHHLVRINLSEQTELSDLLGSDLPAVPVDDDADDGAKKTQAKFKWYDGVFLTAMKEGHWVLLDELNLAPQTVLEGLNACFDHRGQVFLPEIGQTVHCSPYFRIFAAQNPLREGGGRKGLPASFLSRFTKVVFDALSEDDLVSIMSHHNAGPTSDPASASDVPPAEEELEIATEMIEKMVRITHRLNEAATSGTTMFGNDGSPWEFNLRDVMRWCEIARALAQNRVVNHAHDVTPARVLDSDITRAAFFLFGKRLRNAQDRVFVRDVVAEVLGACSLQSVLADEDSYKSSVSTLPTSDMLNHSNLFRSFSTGASSSTSTRVEDGNAEYALLRMCVQLQLPVLVVGPQGSDRKGPIAALAKEYGKAIRYFAAFPSLDSTEMLGAYGQTTWEALVQDAVLTIEDLLTHFMASSVFGSTAARLQSTLEEEVVTIAAQISNIHRHLSASFSSDNVSEHPQIVVELATIVETLAAVIVNEPQYQLPAYTARLQQLKRSVSQLQARETASSKGAAASSASFQWEDGAVVSAIQSGEWLIFDHVNLAPASVLDRLNSLLEPHGTLLLTEDGSGRHIIPHPDFRIFFVMDPMFGEISRAMRNRCVEISRAMRNRCVEVFHDFTAPALNTLPILAALSQPQLSLLSSHQLQVSLRAAILKSAYVEERTSQGAHLLRTVANLGYFLSKGDQEVLPALQQALWRVFERSSEGAAALFDASEASTDEYSPLLSLQKRGVLHMLHLSSAQYPQLKQLITEHLLETPLYAGSFRYEHLAQRSDLKELLQEALQASFEENSALRQHYLLFTLSLLSLASSSDDHVASLHLSDDLRQKYTVIRDWASQANTHFQQLNQRCRNLDGRLSSNHLLWLRLSSAYDEYAARLLSESKDDHGLLTRYMSGEASVPLLQLSAFMRSKLLTPSSSMLLLVRELGSLLQVVSDFVDHAVVHVSFDAANASQLLTDVLRARGLLLRLLSTYKLNSSGDIANGSDEKSSFPAAALVVSIQHLEKSLEVLQAAAVVDKAGAAKRSEVKTWFASVWKYLYQQWDASGLVQSDSESLMTELNGQLIELERPQSIPTSTERHRIVSAGFLLEETLRRVETLGGDKAAAADKVHNFDTMVMPFRASSHKKLQQECLKLLSTYRMMAMRPSEEEDSRWKSNQRLELMASMLQNMNDRANKKATSAALVSLDDIRQEISVKEFSERETFLLANAAILTSQSKERRRHILSPIAFHFGTLLIESCKRACLAMGQLLLMSGSVVQDVQIDAVRDDLQHLIAGVQTTTRISMATVASAQVVQWLLDCLVRNDPSFPAAVALEMFRSVAPSVMNELEVLRRDLEEYVALHEEDHDAEADHQRLYQDFSVVEMFILEQQSIVKKPRAEAVYDALLTRSSSGAHSNSYKNVEQLVTNGARLSPWVLRYVSGAFQSVLAGETGFSRGIYLSDQSSLRKKIALDFLGQVSAVTHVPAGDSYAVSVIHPQVALLRTRIHTLLSVVRDALPAAEQHNLLASLQSPSVDLASDVKSLYEALRHLTDLGTALDAVVAPLRFAAEQLVACFDEAADEIRLLETLALAARVVHELRFDLSIPSSPLDPSHLQAWRARLYAQEAQAASQCFATTVAVRTLAGYPLVDQTAVVLGEDALRLQKLVAAYQQRVFIRRHPRFVSEEVGDEEEQEKQAFEELYAMLRSAKTSGALQAAAIQGLFDAMADDARLPLEVQSLVTSWLSNADTVVSVLRQKFSPMYDDYVVPIVSAMHGVMQAVQWGYAAFALKQRRLASAAAPSGAVVNVPGSDLRQRCMRSILTSPVLRSHNFSTKNRWVLFSQMVQTSMLWSQGLASPRDSKSLLNPILLQFVRLYQEEEAERKKASSAKASMYKSRQDEEDDTDEKRAERSFRQQFPDHMSALKKYLEPASADRDEDEADMDVDEADGDDADVVGGGKLLDDVAMVLRVVSTHMRFVLSTAASHVDKKAGKAASALQVYRQQEAETVVQEYRSMEHDAWAADTSLFAESQRANHYGLELAAGVYWHLGLHQAHHRVDEDGDVDVDQSASAKSVSFAPAGGRAAKGKAKKAVVADEFVLDRDLAYLLNPFPHESNDDAIERIGDDHFCPRNIEEVGAFPEEIMLAMPPLRATEQSVRLLLQQFPGNEILFKILRLCLQIMNASVAQLSLSKMLVQFQVLLQVMQEWEQVAAKHVSLAAAMKRVTSMIIRWRRFEYSSWTTLLRKTEVQHCQQAAQHWFSLMKVFQLDVPLLLQKYRKVKLAELQVDWQRMVWWEKAAAPEPTVHPEASSQALHSVLPEDVQSFLATFVKTIDTFLRTATVGEFAARLHLVRAMSLMLHQEDAEMGPAVFTPKTTTVRQYLHRHLTHLLLGIWHYFAQFLPVVRRFQELLRAPLHERVKNEVKFGKWDDLNAYALLENSEKVHRKLHKIVQEYDKDVLSTSVQMLIDRETTKNLVNEAGELIPAVEVPSDAQLYPLALAAQDDRELKIDDYLDQFLDRSLIFATKKKATPADRHAEAMLAQLPATLQKLPSYVKKVKSYLVDLFDVTYLLGDGDGDGGDGDGDDEAKTDEAVARTMPATSVNYSLQAADLCESMSQEVFDRIASLRGADVKKNMKWRAVRDLMETLHDHGFSALQSMLPSEIRDNAAVLSQTSYVSVLLAQDLHFLVSHATSGSDVSRNVLEKGEFYFQRNLMELWQLRVQAVSTHSPDVSHRDVLNMLHLAESMLVQALRLRSTAGEALREMVAFQRTHHTLSTLVAESVSLTAKAQGASPVAQWCAAFQEVDIRVRLLLRCFVRLYLMLRALQDGSELFDHMTDSKKSAALLQAGDGEADDQLVYDLPPKELLLTWSHADIGQAVAQVHEMIETLMKAASLDPHVAGPMGGRRDAGLFTIGAAKTMLFALRRHASSMQALPSEAVVIEQLPQMFAQVNALQSHLTQLQAKSSVFGVLQGLLGRHKCDEVLSLVAEVQSIQATLATTALAVSDEQESEVQRLMAACVDAARLSVQRLLSRTPQQRLASAGDAEPAAHADASGDDSTPSPARASDVLTAYLEEALLTLRSCVCARSLSSALEALTQKLSALPLTYVSRIAPVLSVLRDMVDLVFAGHAALIDQHLLAYKAFTKLSYVVLRVFRNLVAKGICSQQADGDGENNGNENGGNVGDMRFEDDVDGTGMGEGDGKKDVSNEIENEEQLLGNKDQSLKDLDEKPKDEQKPKETLDKNEKDTGVEMTQDFDGDMFDLPSEDEEEEKENRRNEEEDEDDEGDELDREMGDADEDDIVDERQWDSDEEDDDDKDDGKDKQEKFEKDSKMKGDTIEDEMHTKDTDEDDTAEAGDEDHDGPDKAPQKKNDEDGGEEDADNDDANQQPNGGDGNLPDEEPEKKDDPLEKEQKPNFDKKNKKKQKQPLTHGIHDEAGNDRILNQPQTDADEEAKEDEEKETGPGGDDHEEDDHDDRDAQDESAPQNKDKKPSSSSASSSGEDSGDNSNRNPSQPPSASDQRPSQRQQPRNRQEKNPFLQMGDIEKEWHRRLNIQDKADEANDGHLHDSDDEKDDEMDPSQRQDAYEYADQHDASNNLSQVLAASDKDKAKQLPQSGEIPDESHDREDDASDASDADDDGSSDEGKVPPKFFDEADDVPPQKPTYRETKQDPVDSDREERKRDRDESSQAQSMAQKEQPQRKKRRKAEKNEPLMDVDGEDEQKELDELDNNDDGPAREEAQPARSDAGPADPMTALGKAMYTSQQFVFGAKGDAAVDRTEDDEKRVDGRPVENRVLMLSSAQAQQARQRWQQYRSQTEAHALRLSETLRLILAPTLATRLQGDYRTGKRINMRKVIPYIASGYRKDKIWLRRTKPAKRAYQIMLMIDDSRSMGQSTAGQLAMSSLAMLSTALVRLEVGELCIASFARDLNVIHPFGKTFTEDVGTQVAAHFQFQAEETNVSQSLQDTIPVFQRAKDSLLSSHSSNGDTAVLQICFLLSDARVDTDNRQRLEQIIRTMSEQHILVVLVIIDCNQDARDSIFQTKSVKFTNQGIVTTHYFDDFPFPYYVAIQEVGKLPDVLADALKQWFEMIKMQLSNQLSST